MARNFGFNPATTQPYYFISYNSEDAARVSAICRELDRRGVSMWYDKGLLVGEKWEKQITLQIKNCHEMIIFVTKKLMARENPFVQKEFALANKFHRKINIVMLDEIAFDDVSDDLKVWFLEIEALHGVYPPANSAPAQVADAMEGPMVFVKKPEDEKIKNVENTTAKTANEKPLSSKKSSVKRPTKKQKIILICSTISALLITFGIWFVTRYDDPSYYSYKEWASGEIEITGLQYEKSILKIPEKIEEKPVTDFASDCFRYYDFLTSVTIPSSVNRLSHGMFFQCHSLTKIDIPSSVTVIEYEAFSSCDKLDNVRIPSSVTTIEAKAFKYCTSMTRIDIPPSVTSIGENAFVGCSNLTIYGKSGSYAEQYAEEENIPFKAKFFLL